MIALGVFSDSAFPYREYRPGQREALEQARTAFESGRRHVLIEAPTGAGKSAIAYTLARSFPSAFIVTAQKLLQDQYLRDFPDLSLMKGRANYPCLIAPTHAAAAPCLVGRKLPECEDCPYFTAKDEAMAASGTIMNYAYFLTELNYAGGFDERELLVLDEAHNAEGALMSFAQVHITDQQLRGAGIVMPLPQALSPTDWFDFAEDVLPEMSTRARQLDEEGRKATIGSEQSVQLLRNKQWLDSTARRLAHLVESHASMETDWVVDHGRTAAGQWVTFKPVQVDAFAEEFLFGHARHVLLLSATILDTPTYLQALGLREEDVEVIRVPSYFPPQNRPIRLRPSARLSRHHLDTDLPKLTAAVARILEDHPTEKGVIHSHSYRIAEYVHRNLPPDLRRRVVRHIDASGRDAALMQHMGSPDPTVLLTPSMTEGIDLVDDLARFQIICKIPYPFIGDAQVKARMDRDPAWYQWRTCLSVVQAYGRSVRAADDYAVTYLLDAQFPDFLRRQRNRLPDWFLEAIEED